MLSIQKQLFIARSQYKIRRKKSRLPFRDDSLNNPPVFVGLLGRHQGPDREDPQRVGNGQGVFRGVLSAGEGKGVRPAPALAVDVDPAHLVDRGKFTIFSQPP